MHYKKWQTDTHRPRNGEDSGRSIVPALKMSYRYRFGTSCCKMTDVFDGEARNEQEMKVLPKHLANRHSPDQKSII